jgi:hypothetical protein
MRPTRILRAPYKLAGTDCLGRNRTKVMVDTDAGTFDFYDLAKAIEVSAATLRTRLWRGDGWKSPHALNPPSKRGHKLDGRPLNNSEQGNDEWRSLGKRVRNENLARIPG